MAAAAAYLAALGLLAFGILALVAACAKTLLILIDLGLGRRILHFLLYYCTCSCFLAYALSMREEFT